MLVSGRVKAFEHSKGSFQKIDPKKIPGSDPKYVLRKPHELTTSSSKFNQILFATSGYVNCLKNARPKRLVTSTQRPEVDFAAYSKHPIFGPMATPCETPAYVKQVKVKLDFLGLAKTLLHSESPTVNQGFGGDLVLMVQKSQGQPPFGGMYKAL